jgi:hypothetical protein
MLRKTYVLVTMAVVVAVTLLMPAYADAQAVRFGVKAGVDFSKLRGEIVDAVVDGTPQDLFDFGTGTGFVGGAFVRIPVGGGFAFQPEVLYQSRISKLDIPQFDDLIPGEFSASVRGNYLQVPVLLQWQPGDSGLRPVLFAGPAIAFRLDATVRAEAFGMAEEEDVTDETKSSDFGLIFGAGLAFGRFGAEVRYDLGLTNIADDSASSLKWGTLSLLGGITF